MTIEEEEEIHVKTVSQIRSEFHSDMGVFTRDNPKAAEHDQNKITHLHGCAKALTAITAVVLPYGRHCQSET